MPGIEMIDAVHSVLDRWQAGIAAHRPDQVAAVFTDDAIFQGLRPYTVGRQGVFDYYESQPVGLTVDYRINEIREPAAGVVLAYARADFTRPDGEVISLNLSVLVTQGDNGWQIAHYQVSQIG
ncbi:SgcJ/EcaC family oxidoreductase [Mycolicibacterium sp. 141076]|uniref:YybH family protein n=1 Tax=Mycolicibacterium sp. 141076 TaxID=3090599 RepID=UPI00299DD844|nr:SgcJ/EcaC family oxidoreductase [Mycolicibacterium sp. 141076]MDX1881124.1 SgcJ/EcaC family oxidoreductase [Mycolicibacterium sp. 141076]